MATDVFLFCFVVALQQYIFPCLTVPDTRARNPPPRLPQQLKSQETPTDITTVMAWADDRDVIVARVMEEMDLDGGGEITFDGFQSSPLPSLSTFHCQ